MITRFALISFAALAVTACVPAGGGVAPSTGASPSLGGGGATPSAATKVTLASSGTDSCGAADFAFLTGQSFAHTFDINLPSGTRYFGRSERADALNNPNRMNVNVSTRRAYEANTNSSAKITRVYCG